MKIVWLIFLSLVLIFQFMPEALAEGDIENVAAPGSELSLMNPPSQPIPAQSPLVKAGSAQDKAPVIMTGPVTILDENS